MDCDQSERLWARGEAEALEDAQAREVSSHLDACEHCRGRHAALRAALSRFDMLPREEPPSELRARIERKLSGEAPRRAPEWLILGWGLAAAAVILVMLVHPRPAPRPPVAPSVPAPVAKQPEPAPAPAAAQPAPARPGFLGIQGDDGDEGVRITFVVRNTPAAQAGLRTGDVVSAVNGKPVKSIQALAALLREIGAGREAKIEYRREERACEATAILASRAEEEDDEDEDD